MAKDDDLTSNEAMKMLETIDKAVELLAFGKTKPKTLKKIDTKKRVSDEELLEAQSKRVEKEILKIENEDKGKVGRIYKMKKDITGERCKRQEPVAIRDPDYNVLIVAPEEIKKVTLQYCKDNLKKKDKAESYAQEDVIKKELHEARMNDDDDDGFEVTKEDFDEVIKRFKKKYTKAYDFLIKADEEYKDAIFLLCKKFIGFTLRS